MSRTMFRWVLFVMMFSLFVWGCGEKKSTSGIQLPSDPVEALKEINKTGQTLTSAHFTMDITMDMDAQGFNVTLEMDAEGDVEMKGPTPADANMSMTMNMSMLGQDIKMEMVALNGEFWMREGDGSWQKVPASQANLTGGLGGDPAAALRYLENAKNVKKLGDEKVDGVDCYRFSFTMDADALGTPEMLGQLMGTGVMTGEQAQKMLETAVVEGVVWVGRADLYPRRQTMDMTFDIAGLPGLGDATVKYDMQIDIKFSKINEPVQITAPTN